MPIVIENIPVKADKRSEFVQALFALRPGQSFVTDRSYGSCHTGVRQAKLAVKRPLIGEFGIEHASGGGTRVGRIS